VSARLTELQPWLYPWAAALVRAAQSYGGSLSSVRRSYSEQLQLYENYRRGLSRYPALPPGRSLHQVGRAFDIAAPDRVLRWLGRVWESWGGRWGGRDGTDPIHFEA